VVGCDGTDFFLAGARRVAAEGARIGVHSWSTGEGMEATEFPMDSTEHDRYLEYYREMGIPEDFYWFTIQAAPADDMHYMTAEEIALYNILTE